MLEKTVIIIAADHGESLGEHHESFHGFFVYDATVRIPLVVNVPSPRLRGRVVASQVENVDIMPSILQLLGQAVPAEVQGRSFLPLVLGDAAVEERLAYSESYYPRYHYGWSELKSLSSAAFRYVRAPVPEVYDLVRDPGETKNVFYDRRDIAERYERSLRDMEARRHGARRQPARPEGLGRGHPGEVDGPGLRRGLHVGGEAQHEGPSRRPQGPHPPLQ